MGTSDKPVVPAKESETAQTAKDESNKKAPDTNSSELTSKGSDPGETKATKADEQTVDSFAKAEGESGDEPASDEVQESTGGKPLDYNSLTK